MISTCTSLMLTSLSLHVLASTYEQKQKSAAKRAGKSVLCRNLSPYFCRKIFMVHIKNDAQCKIILFNLVFQCRHKCRWLSSSSQILWSRVQQQFMKRKRKKNCPLYTSRGLYFAFCMCDGLNVLQREEYLRRYEGSNTRTTENRPSCDFKLFHTGL